jgi:hypothetical protein
MVEEIATMGVTFLVRTGVLPTRLFRRAVTRYGCIYEALLKCLIEIISETTIGGVIRPYGQRTLKAAHASRERPGVAPEAVAAALERLCAEHEKGGAFGPA